MSRPSSPRLVVFGLLLVGCASVSVSPLATHGGSDGGVDGGADLARDADMSPSPDLAMDAALPVPDLAPPPCVDDTICTTSSFGAVCDTTTGVCVECVASHDTCPTNHYCVAASDSCEVGCKTGSDCTAVAGGTAALTCDTGTHHCVGCVVDGDCQPGTVCSGQACVPGCNASHECDSGRSCCTGQCANLMTDATHCGGCGNVCDTTHSFGRSCAQGTCAYAGCEDDYADCAMTGADTDGCETSATTTANCGKCGSCDTGGIIESSTCVVPQSGAPSCAYQCGCSTAADSVASTCDGTKCSYTCAAGHADCDSGGSDTDGCECPTASSTAQGANGCCASGTCQTAHTDGFGDSFYDCVAAGTFDAMQALEAASAATNITGIASDGWTCGTSTNMGTGVCKQSANTCACWIYSSTGSVASAGHAIYNAASNSCYCAGGTDPSWN